MFEVYGYTYNDTEFKKSMIDGDFAVFTFNQIIAAEDTREASIVDACTGEIIISWQNGQVSYIKDVGLDRNIKSEK